MAEINAELLAALEKIVLVASCSKQSHAIYCGDIAKEALAKAGGYAALPDGMRRFVVGQHRDAVRIYEAVIVAPTAQEALAIADADACKWREIECHDQDARSLYVYAIEDEDRQRELASKED